MPRRRMNTRTIKEILRLRFSWKLSTRQISKSVNASVGAVHQLVSKAEQLGLGWPLPADIGDERLEEILYSKPEALYEGKVLPDFSYVDEELTKKGVTRQLLWEEYTEANKGKNYYSYTRFCELYYAWRKKNRFPSMRQVHKAGEKCFVDYAGLTMSITDPHTGEETKAQIFVGVMGASNYIFAEATASQTLEDWLGSHTRMLEFFGGVPEIIVPDNPKSGVTRACRYDPDTNPAYAQWANHYNTIVIPTRPRKPKDKAKAENAVQIVERRVLAVIRNEKFFSVAELNKRVKELVGCANKKPFQKEEGCRRGEFEKIDLPKLKPLPPYPYIYTEIKTAKVNIDYHVEYKKVLYSVPYIHMGERVEIRASQNIVTIYLKNRIIAQHKRERKRWSTEFSHMPRRHQQHYKWNPQRLRSWAVDQGEEVSEWLERQFELKDHPEQVYRTFLGLMSLSEKYPQRLNGACRVANRKGLTRYKQVREILKNGRDKLLVLFEEEEETVVPQDHKNIRGPGEFR